MTRDLPSVNNLTIEQEWQLGFLTTPSPSSVRVFLKSHETSWLERFIELQGTSVLGQALMFHSDMSLENEIAKGLKIIFNCTSARGHKTQWYHHPNRVFTSSTDSQIDLRGFLPSVIYISKDALSFVFPASGDLDWFNEVSTMNDPNDKRNVPGYYEYLFRSLESALLGRGKMGSLVGASEEVRKGSGHDSSFQEYARIITLCREIGTEPMEAQLDQLQAILEDGELRLRERYDQEILRDLRSTEDIWNTIRRVMENTDAKEYFLYDATSLEKEALEEEMSQGHDGLVGNLKAQVALLKQTLNSTRETTKCLQGQLETQKTGYEEQIGQLEAQIMELFRMKEAGKGYEKILDSNSGTMDRKNLIENLNKY
ncbi:hypothetical protein M405DRAFT_839644 [Rhizopogon salebrosus TDB-379]|nr:hypothetical protein M405DRAFT_839644 [Rhizopogon salebrosus TDB-379]